MNDNRERGITVNSNERRPQHRRHSPDMCPRTTWLHPARPSSVVPDVWTMVSRSDATQRGFGVFENKRGAVDFEVYTLFHRNLLLSLHAKKKYHRAIIMPPIYVKPENALKVCPYFANYTQTHAKTALGGAPGPRHTPISAASI